MLYECGRFEEALAEYSLALAEKKRLLGDSHRDTCRTQKLVQLVKRKIVESEKRLAQAEAKRGQRQAKKEVVQYHENRDIQ